MWSDSTRRKSQRWDEKNILATYHPPGKEYGLIKVDEPKTPFNRILDDGTEEDRPTGGTFLNPVALTPELLAERLAALDGITPKALQAVEGRSRSRQQDSASKREFIKKRKSHYNEGRFLSQSPPANFEDESDEEGPAGVHLRLAQQLLEQERKAKDNPEDQEILAPVLSKRSSSARRLRLGTPQGKQSSHNKDQASGSRKEEQKGGTEPQPKPSSQTREQQPGVSNVKDPKQQKKSKKP
ncbi:protein phosphatase inhibitor 2-like isoform X5 [Lissotriton helveticus]